MVIASEKSTGKLKKRGADATTITLSISMEDKELAKKLAADCNASVSDMWFLAFTARYVIVRLLTRFCVAE